MRHSSYLLSQLPSPEFYRWRRKTPNPLFSMDAVRSPLIYSTLRSLPATHAILRQTGIPLSVVVRPFKEDVPTVPIHLLRIPKCRSCAAYFSPYTHWISLHVRYYCCQCHEIIAHQPLRYLNADNKHEEIPELVYPCVQYNGQVVDTAGAHTVVVVSSTLVHDLPLFLRTINTPYTILVVDEHVSYPKKMSSGEFAQNIVMDDDLLEFTKGIRFLTGEETHRVSDWCTRCQCSGPTRVGNSVPYERLCQLAIELLHSHGVIHFFIDAASIPHQWNEKDIDRWAVKCNESGIMVNNYIVGAIRDSCSLTPLIRITSLTNGVLKITPSLDESFIKKTVRRIVGYRASARVRVPPGVEVSFVGGDCYSDDYEDCRIGVLTQDTTLVIHCRIINDIASTRQQFQVAITFIDTNGVKCIRVLNLFEHVSSTLQGVLDSVDQAAVMEALNNRCLATFLSEPNR